MVREANMKALASEKALAESNMKVGNMDGDMMDIDGLL